MVSLENEAAASFLDQFSNAVTAIVRSASGAIVRVERRGEKRNGWLVGRSRVNHGSGVIVDAEQGYILTSYHVVRGMQEVNVHLPDGTQVNGKRIGKDPETDLALVKIDAGGLQAAAIGDSSTLHIGAFVIALGNPDGDHPVATSGIISALNRSLRGPTGRLMHGLIQTSALYNPGVSGGPLVNSRGAVIGLNTASLIEAQGVNLAVSSATINKILPDLIAYGVVKRPKLGIAGEQQRIYEGLVDHHKLNQTHGVLIHEVTPDSAAARAGLQPGDIILSMNDEAVGNIDALTEILAGHNVGDVLIATLIRKLDMLEVEIDLGNEMRTG